MIDQRKSPRTSYKHRSGRHKLEYLERAFLRAKNLKPRAPREGIRGEDGPPRGFEVSLVLGSIRGGGFGVWDLERGRACEGEGGHGEGVT